MNQELKTGILSITSIEEWREVQDLMGRMLTHLKSVAIIAFKVNDLVEFHDKKGRSITGKIVKINSTTIKVDCGSYGKWTCSPNLIKKL